MFGLKRLLAGLILVLSFLLGRQLALRAQCGGCYQNSGPAGDLIGAEALGECPCNPAESCYLYVCVCNGLQFNNLQCGAYFYCAGC